MQINRIKTIKKNIFSVPLLCCLLLGLHTTPSFSEENPSHEKITAEEMQVALKACLESNMKEQWTNVRRHNIDAFLQMQCLGLESDRCIKEESQGFLTIGICYSKEGYAWSKLNQAYFDELIAYLPDQEQKDAVTSAQQAWAQSIEHECDYIALRWGNGREALIDAPKCNRNAEAKRAILLRTWLYLAQILTGDE